MSQPPVNPDRRLPPGMPRWVKVLGIIFIILIVFLIILHITGNGFGGHTSSVEYWLQQL